MVFIEVKHKIDFYATYFKLHETIIKFPTLETSNEWGGGFSYVLYDILEAFIYAARCSSFETKRQFIHQIQQAHILVKNSICSP